jgi:DNA-binding NtrC family response regulator
LLRVLQERVIERVGSEEAVAVDLRIIAATHRPLPKMVAAGKFRQDLYYRLRVVPIEVPPLRARRDDLPLLAQHFVERFRAETGRPIEGVSPEAMALLVDHPWPGNVRELENAIEYAFVKARSGQIMPGHLPPEIAAARATAVEAACAAEGAAACGPPPTGGAAGKWCLRTMAGALKNAEYVYVDVDHEPELAGRLIRGNSIPQLHRFQKTKEGWDSRHLVGAQDARKVAGFIEGKAAPVRLSSWQQPVGAAGR